MQSINFMLAPSEYHPVKFKLKGSGVQILAPAVEVDGKSHLLLNTQIDGKLKLLFKGGVFESTGAGFFFKWFRIPILRILCLETYFKRMYRIYILGVSLLAEQNDFYLYKYLHKS